MPFYMALQTLSKELQAKVDSGELCPKTWDGKHRWQVVPDGMNCRKCGRPQ